MDKKYNGIIHWIYGGKKWDDIKGHYFGNVHHDESIKIQAESDKKAIELALEIARNKLNKSTHPGRPSFNTIDIFLKKLESEGKEVPLDRIETGMSRPIF